MFAAVTSLTRAGVEACVDFAAAVVERVKKLWLHLPPQVCEREPVDLGPLEKYLEPLLYLVHEIKADWRCYGALETKTAVKLAALVIKAKVYGKIDIQEWDRHFARGSAETPKPAIAIGKIPKYNDVICGAYPLNPVEFATETWRHLTTEEKRELALWITRYISLVTESIDLDNAYTKLLNEGWADVYHKLKTLKNREKVEKPR